MTDVKNELPVAVHHASGGSARARVGGSSISLDSVSSGSFQVTGGTRYRLFANLRSSSGCAVLVGYSSPVSVQNAAMAVTDLNSITDDVPEGTTVYLAMIDTGTTSAVAGGSDDYLAVTIYG